jgi:hypothetical protein
MVHLLGEALIPRRVTKHEVAGYLPFGLPAGRHEQLAEPRFGATAKIHVPRTERQVLLPGLAQAASRAHSIAPSGVASPSARTCRRASSQ